MLNFKSLKNWNTKLEKFCKTASQFPNRRLFEKTVSWDWQKPFCLLAGAGQGERSEQGVASKNLQNTNWLAILHLARTFFEKSL